MSVDFIKARTGSASIHEAQSQQDQILYLTTSEVQPEITSEYYKTFAERNFATNEVFLNWVKSCLSTANFMTFFKYFRYPTSSSEIIQDRVKDPLSRVMFSEDAYFEYTVNDEEANLKDIFEDKFHSKIFEYCVFYHNDVIITNLEDINKPFRKKICIDDIVAIDVNNDEITQIAYSSSLRQENELGEVKSIDGYTYIDDTAYIFYDNNYNVIDQADHDLGRCPAVFVSSEKFTDGVVRKSLFTFVRPKLEEYVFLKTLQKMTEPNGAIPVVTMLKANEKRNNGGDDAKGLDKEPMSSGRLTSQQSDEFSKSVQESKSPLNAGTLMMVDPKGLRKDDGSIDMAVVENYFKFHYTPIEALEYLDTRLKEIEQSIITSTLGDFSESNEDAKNELQVSKSFVSKEDKLRRLSRVMSDLRKRADLDYLELKYGKDKATVNLFYGSDFFLENQKFLYDLLKESPNSIERKEILVRLSKNRNRFNPKKSAKDRLLYDLLPYVSDKDFEIALEQQAIDSTTLLYYNRFNYWINQFEAIYGDLLAFYEGLETSSTAERLNLINTLITNLILEYERENKTNNQTVLPQGENS